MNLYEYVEKLDNDNLFFYLGENTEMEDCVQNPILLFTHELTRTGAPIALLDMSKILIENGYCVFLISPCDGELRNAFIEAGINLIWYPQYIDDTKWMNCLADIFDIVVVNTLLCAPAIRKLAFTVPHIYWWIHESEFLFQKLIHSCRNVPDIPSVHLLSASSKVQRSVRKYMNRESDVLNIMVEDSGSKLFSYNQKKVLRFLQVGTFDINKGQLLLLDAMQQLPADIFVTCEFMFCGSTELADANVVNRIKELQDKYSNVKLIPSMDHGKLLDLYDSVDVIVIPSYSETTSLIAVEGLMKRKIVVSSDGCGISDYLTDGENAFVFPAGNAELLRNKIEYIVTHYGQLQNIKNNGRIVFENNFTKEIFEKAFLTILKNRFIINKNMSLCSACGSCVLSCPVNAISLKTDNKGFLYPSVDMHICVKCGKCAGVCPVNNDNSEERTPEIYAIKLLDVVKRCQSQSGGAFTALAEKIFEMGGIVYGVGLKEDLTAAYMRIDREEKLFQLKGSKYVQAEIGDCFNLVLRDIENGRKVLFSGTACHIDGLLRFLENYDTSNLITCDLVCHGVPSPAIYMKYIEYREKEYGKIIKFNFRDKMQLGWHTHIESWETISGSKNVSDEYTDIFYTNDCLRECCYHCKYTNLNRISDITIGDFWGIERIYPDMDDNLGTSLVLVNTGRGKELFQEIGEIIESRTLNPQQCMQMNLMQPTARPDLTEEFWNDFFKGNFKYLIQKYGKSSYSKNATAVQLTSWLNKLNKGQTLVEYFYQAGLNVIGIYGDSYIAKLVFNEFSKHGDNMPVFIDVYNEVVTETFCSARVVKLKDFVKKELGERDILLIADEVHFSDILERLLAAGLGIAQIVPLSFAISEEV